MKKYILLLSLLFAFCISTKAATFTVTNTNNAGIGSLRQAIIDANANAGADNVDFAIVGTAPFTINLLSDLPPINETLVFDGSTQIGFTGTPLVEINWDGNILDFAFADNSSVTNLAFINTIAPAASDIGVVSIGGNNITVSNNTFQSKAEAIQIDVAINVTVLNNQLIDTGNGTLSGLLFADILGTININGNTFTGNYGSAYTFINTNNLIISDGSIAGTNVSIPIGSGTGLATDNILNFSGGTSIQVANLDLSYTGGGNSGNALDINTDDVTITNVKVEN